MYHDLDHGTSDWVSELRNCYTTSNISYLILVDQELIGGRTTLVCQKAVAKVGNISTFTDEFGWI